MRDKFAKYEAECASNVRGETDLLLFEGGHLHLQIRWNAGAPNKPDGMRDWR